MPSQTLIKFTGTPVPLVWADTTDFSVTGVTRTDQIDLTSVADAAARQGAKGDLGALPAPLYTIEARLEYAVAPTSGDVAKVYLAWSRIATAASLNPGGVSGSDAAYTGTAGDSLADSIKQLDGPWVMTLTSDATTVVQLQHVGFVTPKQRYVTPVLLNDGGQALFTDAVEMYISLVPVIPEAQ